MASERDDIMLEHLKAIREDLRMIKARQLEHTSWLSKLEGGHASLEGGQALLLQMVTRLDVDVEQIKRLLNVSPAA